MHLFFIPLPFASLFFFQQNNQGQGSTLRTKKQTIAEMGRGVSAGGGQSSLGYLFGNKETANNSPPAKSAPQPANNSSSSPASAAAPQPIDKQVPAGTHGYLTNNYQRAEGQNCGNFITERPSTKVHAAPGGGSSLGYLFGGGENNLTSPRK